MLRNKGFTLLEILIALFVFSIISLIMVSALHTALNTQTVTEKNAERFSQLEITFNLVSRDMEQIIDRPIVNAKGSTEAALIGTSTDISFTHAGLANPFGELTRSTLQRTHYFLSKSTLIRESWPELDRTTKTISSQRELVNDIVDLRFQYLDQEGKFQHVWPPQGQTQVSMPKAIRIELTFKNHDKMSQLYLIPGQPLGTPTN
jgi:general secretion pathway protein J